MSDLSEESAFGSDEDVERDEEDEVDTHRKMPEIDSEASENSSAIVKRTKTVKFHSNTNEAKKKRKCGIIYISTLPQFMNVTKVRQILSLYGEIGRIFLQRENTNKKKWEKFPKKYTEGWVEFKSKRVAKQVAAELNNTRIEGRKKSKFYDCLWNLKYLPRFKWVHLDEKLAYERETRKRRLNNEIAQAKREANIITYNFEKSKYLNRKNKRTEDGSTSSGIDNPLQQYNQRKTETEILEDKKKKKKKVKLGTQSVVDDENDNRSAFLKNLFGS